MSFPHEQIPGCIAFVLYLYEFLTFGASKVVRNESIRGMPKKLSFRTTCNISTNSEVS